LCPEKVKKGRKNPLNRWLTLGGSPKKEKFTPMLDDIISWALFLFWEKHGVWRMDLWGNLGN